MLPTEIEGVSGASPAEPAEKPTESIGRDDFLRMLIAQLENQDPLNPQDPTEFTAQLATFSNLEQQVAIRKGIDELVEAQRPDDGSSATDQLLRSLTATSMVGRDVVAAVPQFQVTGEEDDPTPLRFELGSAAPDVRVEIRDARGFLVRVIGDDEIAPGNAALAQGEQIVGWDRKDAAGRDVSPGVYRFDVVAEAAGGPVPVQPFLEGRVTGAGMGEEPLLYLGDVSVPLSNVVEVRESQGGGS
jgi:flagellar basal-body rod modification protein FlgD